MTLEFFQDESLTTGSVVDPVDTFVGDGVTSTFVLVNKNVQRMGSTVQVGSTQYYQYNGGFTKDIGTNSFTLSVVPPVGAQIVAPGISQVVSYVFDQSVVPGVTNPRVSDVPIWIGDTTSIQNQYYLPLPSDSGIAVSLVDTISSVGAQVSWCQFAAASPSTGNALSYGPTGATFYTPGISAFSTVASAVVAGASSVLLASASAFSAGDYVYFNVGNSSQEIRKVSSISVNTLLLTTGLDFSHSIDETVITCGRKFWLRVTIPPGAAGNEAVNFYDLALRRQCRVVSRV